MKKSKKALILDRSIAILAILYTLIRFFFLPLFFREKITQKNINFRFNSLKNYEISEEKLNLFLQEISEENMKNPFFDENLSVDIYFCSSRIQYAFWNPLTAFRGSMAVTTKFLSSRTIMLSNPDFSTLSLVYSKKNGVKERKILDVINHEMTHCYLRAKFNFIERIKRMPRWKEEGLAEYVARSSSYNIDEGISKLKNNQRDRSPEFLYLEYRLAVSYMINYEKLSFEQILSDKRSYQDILQSAVSFDSDVILSWLNS
ncbi:MAG: hypothetical protein K5681_02630 [Treponema sp.]|nr:hypothetical protein [Treponema sp.]